MRRLLLALALLAPGCKLAPLDAERVGARFLPYLEAPDLDLERLEQELGPATHAFETDRVLGWRLILTSHRRPPWPYLELTRRARLFDTGGVVPWPADAERPARGCDEFGQFHLMVELDDQGRLVQANLVEATP